MAGTGDTRTLPDCCDPAGQFGALCAGVWQGGGGKQETSRQASGQATRRVGRIVGAERHYAKGSLA
jgi:hypothetical protein